MADAKTVRAGRGEVAGELVDFEAPVSNVYEVSRENARMYVRVVLGDNVIPPQSQVDGFWLLIGEVA